MPVSFPLSLAPTQELAGDAGDVIVRAAGPEERSFVVRSWADSYESLMPLHAKTHGRSRWGWTQYCAERLFDKGAICLVAHFLGLPEATIGWACGEAGKIHYVYVRNRFQDPGTPPVRRHGFGSTLVAELVKTVGPVRRITHRPGTGRGNLREKCHALGWRYEALTPEELEER